VQGIGNGMQQAWPILGEHVEDRAVLARKVVHPHFGVHGRSGGCGPGRAAQAPLHQHPEEQIGTVLEGECEFELNGVKRTIRPGDVYVIPPHVPHSARAYDKPCVALDIFSPPRSGFREMLERTRAAQAGGTPADPVTSSSQG